MERVRRALSWCWLQVLLVGLALGSLGWNLAAILLRPLMPGRSAVMVGRWAIAHGYQVFWWIAQRTGMMQLDTTALCGLRGERGLVVVANHPSLLDAMLLVGRLPRAACIMKASLLGNPLLSAGAQMAGYLPNDTSFGLIKRAVSDLHGGGQILMFPEGTRTVDGVLRRMRPGYAAIACRASAAVQVVFIETDSPYLGKGWPLWRLPPLPIRFTARLGERFSSAEGVDALHRAVKREFCQHGPYRVNRLEDEAQGSAEELAQPAGPAALATPSGSPT